MSVKTVCFNLKIWPLYQQSYEAVIMRRWKLSHKCGLAYQAYISDNSSLHWTFGSAQLQCSNSPTEKFMLKVVIGKMFDSSGKPKSCVSFVFIRQCAHYC